jgi:hypothetical protein
LNINQVILFLDYDGTLRDFEKEPMAAVPSEELNLLFYRLCELKEKLRTVIISGRGAGFLQNYMGSFQQLTLVAEHGYQVRFPYDDEWETKGANVMIICTHMSISMPWYRLLCILLYKFVFKKLKKKSELHMIITLIRANKKKQKNTNNRDNSNPTRLLTSNELSIFPRKPRRRLHSTLFKEVSHGNPLPGNPADDFTRRFLNNMKFPS